MASFKIKDDILIGARIEASSFYNQRPDSNSINLLVIHNISLPAGQFGLPYIEQLFLGCLDCQADPSFDDLKGLQVSSHLLIRRDGEVVQFVPFNQRAWHAGVSSYQGVGNCNDYSIGIELEGTDDIPYTKQQYSSLVDVSYQLLQYYPDLQLDRICGHNDIAPGRKTDPGPSFDWNLYLTSLGNKVTQG